MPCRTLDCPPFVSKLRLGWYNDWARLPAIIGETEEPQIPAQYYLGQADNWQSDTRLRPVEVVVCTATGIFAGRTYRLDRQRLLDALNQGLGTKGSPMGRDFIPLTQVEVCFPDGRRESLTSTFIRKANILFVGEKNKGQVALPTDKEGKQRPHWREKRPIGTEVHVPSYFIVGNMHSEIWQELLETLDSDERFLPLTNVRISPDLATGDSRFDFVAINKDQINYLGQSPEDRSSHL